MTQLAGGLGFMPGRRKSAPLPSKRQARNKAVRLAAAHAPAAVSVASPDTSKRKPRRS